MSKRVTRNDCLTEAYKCLTTNTMRAEWHEAYAEHALAWIELARELERGSLRIEE